MSGLQSQFQKRDDFFTHPPYISPMLSPPTPSSPSSNKLSPAIILIIVIVAAIFFISSLLHILVKYLAKYSSSSSISQSNRYTDFNNSGSGVLQRQLQQLFHLHDSGIDQVLIDALPVFQYKEIVGSKEAFDCAVCLCEFSEKDKLRLLPLCSHAFHIDCIDRWLLSNSTCPLCRGTLFTPGLPIENPMFVFDDSREENELQEDVNENGVSSNRQKPEEIQGIVGETRKVVHIRLGRFTTSSNINGGDREQHQGETSNLDARRCYSMGSLQYVVDNTNLPVALFSDDKDGNNGDLNDVKGMGTERQKGYSIFNNGGDIEGNKLSNTSKGESFSVSKIWLWSKKDSKLSSHNFLL